MILDNICIFLFLFLFEPEVDLGENIGIASHTQKMVNRSKINGLYLQRQNLLQRHKHLKEIYIRIKII